MLKTLWAGVFRSGSTGCSLTTSHYNVEFPKKGQSLKAIQGPEYEMRSFLGSLKDHLEITLVHSHFNAMSGIPAEETQNFGGVTFSAPA